MMSTSEVMIGICLGTICLMSYLDYLGVFA